LALATILILLSSLAAVLFTRAFVNLQQEAFEERSLAYVQAFAAASQPWVDQEDVDMLRAAAYLLLAGSATYVRMETSAGLLIDERTPETEDLDLPDELGVSGVTHRIHRDKGDLLDVVVPIPARDGHVQIGISRGAVRAQASAAVAVAAGTTIGFNILLAIILWVGLPRLRRTGSPENGGPPKRIEPSQPLLVAGPLTIDPNRKAVQLSGDPIRVTPKQYVLLELLAGEPGRVFSEREILEAAWPESPYADSKDIKQYVYLVRKRLAEVDSDGRNLIETVPGFGYRLAVESVDREMTGS